MDLVESYDLDLSIPRRMDVPAVEQQVAAAEARVAEHAARTLGPDSGLAAELGAARAAREKRAVA